ncbi:peptidase C15 [Alteribacillus sp. YIM 98480]|uniref:pyroglutamyl-peptidase I family protein n=1 Tax=Alteribacillus sp. YIM 98480 TaxID=2606599 RepID=UPI00131D7F8D|nr:peptidase C15 [Alteribacillus sp. YIM 98480]
MKILVVGFEAFGDMNSNPTERLMEDLALMHFEEANVFTKLLPVNYDECVQQAVTAIETFEPDVFLASGVFPGRTSISLERISINMKDTSTESPFSDNRGIKPMEQKIHEDGPDGIFTTLPNRHLVNRLLECDIPSYISNTAGTFICNNTLYGVLHYINQNSLPIKAGFVHFPMSSEIAAISPLRPHLPYETMLTALNILIQSVIEKENTKTFS